MVGMGTTSFLIPFIQYYSRAGTLQSDAESLLQKKITEYTFRLGFNRRYLGRMREEWKSLPEHLSKITPGQLITQIYHKWDVVSRVPAICAAETSSVLRNV